MVMGAHFTYYQCNDTPVIIIGTCCTLTVSLCFFQNTFVQIAIKNLNKEVATKEYLSKFLPREIEILQRVQHPNIIQVFQIIETEKKAFLMLELAENGDLLDYINSRRYLHEPEARFIFRQMSGGIAYCHSLDIIHRDLKCENIMLSKDMDVKIGGKSLSTIIVQSIW